MDFYACITIITVLLMITMIVHVLHYKGFTKRQKIWFILTFISILVCQIAEFGVHCGYYNPSFKILMTIVTIIQFSLAPVLGVMFLGALGLKYQKKVAIIYLAISFFIEVLAAPFGWIFYFNDDGYFRGAFFIIYGIFYFISLLYLIIGMIVVGNNFKNRDVLTIIMVLVILVAGVIPMTFFNLNVTYLAIAISSSICYIYYNDLVQQDIQYEFRENQKKISSMQEHIISGLANLIENRDLETGEHITRTKKYVKLLAHHARLDGVYSDTIDDHYISLLYVLSPLHDIGKILVSDIILKKPGRLTEEEFDLMKKHAAGGGKVVRDLLMGVTDDEYIAFASDIATYHHERYDGKGYPRGLRGREIPLSARIMAIADVFDALTSKRCYKEALSFDEAIKIIKEESGTHFDPLLVEVFLNHKEEFKL